METIIKRLASIFLLGSFFLLSGCSLLLSSVALDKTYGKKINFQNMASKNYLSVDRNGLVTIKKQSQKKDQAFVIGKFNDFFLSINHEFNTLSSHPNNPKSILFSAYEDRYINQSKFEFVAQDSSFQQFQIKSMVSGLYLTEKDGLIIMDTINRSNKLSQIWKIKNANLKGEEKNEASFSLGEGSSIPLDMVAGYLFEDLASAIAKLKADGIIDDNLLIDKTLLGDVLSNANFTDLEKIYYNRIKSEYKRLFKVEFREDWLNFNAAFYDNCNFIIGDIRDSLVGINTNKREEFKPVAEALVSALSDRGQVINTFRFDFDRILVDWYRQASTDLDNLYLNMSLDGEYVISDPPDIFGLMNEAIAIPASAHPGTDMAFSTFNICISIIEELAKEGKNTLNYRSSNLLKETVADFKQYYLNALDEMRKGLRSYLYIILSDKELLAAVRNNLIQVQINQEDIKKDLTNNTRKSLFKSILPIKAILVGFKSSKYAEYDDKNTPYLDEALPLNLNPLAHIGIERTDCDYVIIGLDTDIGRYNLFYQLKIEGPDADSYSSLGEGGNCGLTELRQLWEPDSIYSWLKSDEKVYVEHDFLKYGTRWAKLRTDNSGQTKCHYDDLSIYEFSKITPESFGSSKNEPNIELVFDNIELIDVGEDRGDCLELRGSIKVEINTDGLNNTVLEKISGFTPGTIWEEDDESALCDKIDINQQYLVKILNIEEFNKANPYITITLDVLDVDLNPNDNLSCNNCTNGSKSHVIYLKDVYEGVTNNVGLTLKSSEQEIKINIKLKTIY